ncbi:MAG: DUF6231 family protein [Moraxellaceae bacterium]|nr:DUF6231 family protein [Moraxellaceae bacterium]MDZ4387226.1 DUF6231 family protein [Moraxellaceae bacterium]
MMIAQPARLLAEEALASLANNDNLSALWVASAAYQANFERSPWHWQSSQQLLQQPWQQRHDLAVAWIDGDLSSTQALNLLSALRDLHARKLLAFVAMDQLQWKEDTLLALGLQRQARFEHNNVLFEAWSFDIKTYKAVPDWLNPRFWANPENWNKFRW